MQTLKNTKAADLMQTEVITLQSDAPIREAIATFEDFNIKGAPVVDSAGNLVGVLTETDIAKTGHMRGDRIEKQRGDYYLTDPLEDLDDRGAADSRRSEEFFDKEDYSPELLGSEVVGDWMTPRVISVLPSATLRHVCATMSKESIHRVLVVERNRLLGIITSLDVVRFVAEA